MQRLVQVSLPTIVQRTTYDRILAVRLHPCRRRKLGKRNPQGGRFWAIYCGESENPRVRSDRIEPRWRAGKS
jgi:hypothetical protein